MQQTIDSQILKSKLILRFIWIESDFAKFALNVKIDFYFFEFEKSRCLIKIPNFESTKDISGTVSV
ncbi:hypothetical protein AYB33_10305 [Leptospira santarosai]|nr:hypothetical protein AYB33_10305 [Leptospira santarosai]